MDGLTVASTCLVASVFTVASYTDLKSRSVPNQLWEAAIPLAVCLATLHLIFKPSHLIPAITVLGLILTVGGWLFRRGWFGGADVKALILLSVAMPFHAFPALMTASLASYLYGKQARKKEVPFLPFLLLGFTASLIMAPLIFRGGPG